MSAEKLKNINEKKEKPKQGGQPSVVYDRLVNKIQNNNRLVAPAGLLTVSLTLYMGLALLQQCCECYLDTSTDQEDQKEPLIEQNEYKHMVEEQQPNTILKAIRGLMFCYKGEIFQNAEQDDVTNAPKNLIEPLSNEESQNVEKPKKSKKSNKNAAQNGIGNGSGNGHDKINNKTTKSKAAGKTTDAKKKDGENKTSPAEPIIYLFALIFVYLLLKAASDINQHYKSQTKGDKRLRRCSLQSYAQAHKQDRRASKDSPLRRRQHLFNGRSVSVDRYKRIIAEEADEHITLKSDILTNFRKYTSMEEPKPIWPLDSVGLHTPPTNTPFTSNRDIRIHKFPDNHNEKFSPTLNQRRCSVPVVTINYQTVQLSGMPNRSLSRRTSIVSSSNIIDPVMGVADAALGLIMEPKRRVRMINRH